MLEKAQPLISFYMTVKNGLPYLDSSIGSIINQTYQNWECVVVDDGSIDGTADYLKSLAGQDSRFKVIVSGGIGRGRALNLAIAHTDGEYVANLDADDIAHPERIERQVNFIKNNDIAVISTKSLIFSSGKPRWPNLDDKIGSVDVTRQVVKKNPIAHSSVLIKRSHLLSVGGYQEGRKSQLDYELWGRLAVSNMKLIRLNTTLVAKRVHPGQSFENKNRLSYIWEAFKLKNNIISDLGGGWYDRLYACSILLYWLLPQKTRMFFNKNLFN